ncbi:MAG: RND family efflux transporter MFP subunit [Saprospiraceae bacterium]|jgi:RND family efflux transporter MFP subunit
MNHSRLIKKSCYFLLLCGWLSGCNSPDKQAMGNATQPSAKKVQTVEVVHPDNRSFTAEVLITGSAEPNQSVTVYAMESGVLMSIRKDIGDKVKKGEVIALLENPMIAEMVARATSELAVSRANIKTAEAELSAAKAKEGGLSSIAKRLGDVQAKTPQLVNIMDVETAQANAIEAKAMVESKKAFLVAQQEMIRALEVSLATAKKRQSYLSIRAPFSGTVSKRYVDNGSLLQNGLNQSNPKAIVEIQDTNPIRLTLPVPESDAVAIKKGMDVSLSFPELSGESYKAKISRSSNSLDPMSRTMQVEIDLDNSNGKIITGMYAKVLMQVGSRSNILSLPIMSKVRYKNEDYVLVVENNIVKRIPLKTGLSDKDYFEVLNSDITKESQIIINGKGLVNPGQEVKAILKGK